MHHVAIPAWDATPEIMECGGRDPALAGASEVEGAGARATGGQGETAARGTSQSGVAAAAVHKDAAAANEPQASRRWDLLDYRARTEPDRLSDDELNELCSRPRPAPQRRPLQFPLPAGAAPAPTIVNPTLDQVVELIERMRPILAIIDPLCDVVGSGGVWRLRRAVARLADVAHRTGSAIIVTVPVRDHKPPRTRYVREIATHAVAIMATLDDEALHRPEPGPADGHNPDAARCDAKSVEDFREWVSSLRGHHPPANELAGDSKHLPARNEDQQLQDAPFLRDATGVTPPDALLPAAQRPTPRPQAAGVAATARRPP